MTQKPQKNPNKPTDLSWKRESGWNKITAAEKKHIEAYCADYIAFLSECKTERIAHDWTVKQAEAAGFRPLEKVKSLKAGDKVYRSWRGKTVMLAVIGSRPMSEGLNIVGGHIDSPRLDAKPNPLYEDGGLALLDTHYYGGIKKYHWVAMPLAIHGVVCLKNGKTVEIAIGENPGDPVFCVTDLLPHLGKDQAQKKIDEAITGENLNLLVGSVPVKEKDAKQAVKTHILNLLNAQYGIDEADFASAEIEMVPAGPARDCGLDRSMIIGYGHDDRICAYGALRAILDLKKTPEHTAVALLCDKEEIGSVGATGMESVFFENTTAELMDRSSEKSSQLILRRCLENSRMISADVHSVHDPNFPEVSSPNNMAQVNAGMVVAKYGGSRGKSHSSDASAEFMALIRKVFDDAGVIWQTGELGKVDLGGGGTIAMFLARYGMDVVDAGPGLLSMHAPWEVAGKLDTYMAYKGYAAFLKYAD
jgi:aspartyl aminopeptidase